MGKPKVLVLGAAGMLGTTITSVLSSIDSLEVVRSTRDGRDGALPFDASRDSIAELLLAADCDWIINTIGILRRRMDEASRASVAAAIDVNAKFPHRLAAAASPGRRVIQISTDGVFSGRDGPYDENRPPDGTDEYGRSKSHGEVRAPNVVNLRCSIVGLEEQRPAVSLLGWAVSRPLGAEVVGYSNHLWNGITTVALAKLCAAVILEDSRCLPSPLHIVPRDVVSKADLIELGLATFGRTDVTVSRQPAEVPVNRTLHSRYPDANSRLWREAGYATPPTIAEMIAELPSYRSA
jgi:dTDP-4-dehydrorhamnose reductase